MNDGALPVSKCNLANTLGGSLSGSFRLRPVDGGGDLLLDIQGTGLTMGLPAESPEELAALPKYDLDTVLAGKGRTARELAGSRGGYVRLTSGEGRIRSSGMRYFTGDFLSEVLNAVNPFTKTDNYTSVKCTAVLLAANDGVMSGKPAGVFQTDRIQIFAGTTIDLKTEKLDADIRTVPQKGLGIGFSDLVNPYTRVSGTLASPSSWTASRATTKTRRTSSGRSIACPRSSSRPAPSLTTCSARRTSRRCRAPTSQRSCDSA